MAELLAILAVVVIGAQLSLQAPVNNRLGDLVGRLGAALVSNTVGTTILVVCFVVMFALGGIGGSRGPAGLVEVPLWQLLGGVSGGLWVAISVIAVGRIGVGTIAAAAISGQLVSALVIDQFGFFGLERHSMTWLRLTGVALLILGTVLVATRGRTPATGGPDLSPERDHAEPDRWHPGLIVAVLLSGLAMGVQHPLNAQLSDTVGDFTSALVNFAVGTLLLLVLVAATDGVGGVGRARKADPVYLLGGLFGVITVVGSIIAVKTVGATALFAALVAGQLMGSVALDQIGAFGLDRRPLDSTRIVGLTVLMVGTVLAVI